MQDLKPLREAFGDALVNLGSEYKEIVAIDCDLAGATKIDKFKSAFPDRFFQFGIQEMNAIGVGAGFANSGFRPFVASFAAFITGRYDQIRISVALDDAAVVIVGSHPGLAIGKDGATQMGLEDVNLMRGMPNMVVFQPADHIEMREMMSHIVVSRKPTYLRISRQPVPNVNAEDYKFEFGKGVVLKEGNDITLIASGGPVHIALEVARELEEEGKSIRVINIHTIKPIDQDLILKAAQETRGIITIEDHSIYGGLGSAVAEIVAEAGIGKKVKRLGVKDVFGESADAKELYKKHELDKEGILKNVREFYSKL